MRGKERPGPWLRALWEPFKLDAGSPTPPMMEAADRLWWLVLFTLAKLGNCWSSLSSPIFSLLTFLTFFPKRAAEIFPQEKKEEPGQ